LRFGPGITSADLTFTEDEGDLRIEIMENESVTIESWKDTLEKIIFDDESELTPEEIEALITTTIQGTLGNDTLSSAGISGRVILNASAGNDLLIAEAPALDVRMVGGTGNDVYRYIGAETALNAVIFDNLGTNTLHIEGVDSADVKFTRSGRNMMDAVFLMPDGGSIKVEGWSNSLNTYKLNEIHFDDGTVWTKADVDALKALVEGTPGDDEIDASLIVWGAEIWGHGGEDHLIGSRASDILRGGPGSSGTVTRMEGRLEGDIYQWFAGDESVVIFDAYGENVLIFGEGITSSGVTLSRTGNNLVIHPSVNTDATVTIQGWYIGPAYRMNIRFPDGSEWTPEVLPQL
jgi:Ca2+-binding RTX toxin-like protein